MKDLHIHTIYSDGEDDEYEIIKKVKDANIKEFAICDHNTYVGSKKVYDLVSNDKNLIFHSGIEFTARLSTFTPPVNVHILVRDFDYDDEGINYLVNKYKTYESTKVDRMRKLVKELYNIDISDEEISDIYKKTISVGKPHIYSIIKKYITLDRDTYYKDMNNLETDDLKLDVLEIIAISNKINAQVILAHPIEIMEDHNLNFDDIDRLCKYLKDKGLDSIETHHSKHNQEYYDKFKEIALKYDLKESYGSDYHGYNVKPNVILGKCYKD